MKPSEWLRKAAERFDAGEALGRDFLEARPLVALGYVILTFPEQGEFPGQAKAIDETRVMRFLLAAAIAESEGN